MTITQRKYLEWIGYNDYEIQEVEAEIKNGEKPLVFESEQYNAFENGYKNGLKAKLNFTTISDYPFKNQWHKVSEQIPTEEKDYLVKLTDGTIDVLAIALDGNLEPYLITPKLDFFKDVEKWCEIPEENEC